MVGRLALGFLFGAAACGDPNPRGSAWELGDTDGEYTDDGFGSDGGTLGGDDSAGDDPAGDDGPDADPPPTADPIDCSPAWTSTWIGSPCSADADCTYDGGRCLRDSEGFPCGTCSQACDEFCPDLDGAPTTFCIDGTDVALPQTGYCLSQCDEALLPGGGCRDGYACEVLERVDGSAIADVCIPADMASPPPDGGLVDAIDHEFLIEHFGGFAADPFDFSDDFAGFSQYLATVGVQHDAMEIVEPYNMMAALMCGYTVLLPPRDEWEKIGALGMFTDALESLVGEPVFMRNWWRPPCYNDAVGGAATGDHPDADAVDLDFLSPASRAQAQKFLCETYWAQDIVSPEQIAPGSNLDPRLNMSVGLGGVTIHLGVLSAGGRRFWTYDSYSVQPNSGDCW